MSRISPALVPALVATLCALLVGCIEQGRQPSTPAAPANASPTTFTPTAATVLREWDRARAAAYAAGSISRLRRLYVPGAGAGDLRLLRSYVRRGLVVDGMRTQVLALEVLEESPREVRARVTDRLVGALARGHSGSMALPRDAPTTRDLTLRRIGGRWLMAAVSSVRR